MCAMAKDLALLVGRKQPHHTAQLFGKDCPDTILQRALVT